MTRTVSNRYYTYGDDAFAGGAFADDAMGRQAIKHVGDAGSDFINGVISGLAWKGGRISYSFPHSKGDYHYNGERNNNFGTVNDKIKHAAEFILDTGYGNKANDGFAVEGFTQLKVVHGTDRGATIRYAESNTADPTAYGYFPNPKESGGDIWFGQKANYNNAVQGNYDFATVIHETGHALGLKHGHEAGFGNPAIPKQWDSLEYSVMTYRSYAGDPPTGYSNETYGYPQTYMMADIAALQHMYGANFHVNDGKTVYSWKPNSGNTYVNGQVALHPGGDNIFATIWDGGGHDIYNLSAYHNNVYVDLRPGAYSQFKESQLANLGKYDNGHHIAGGNIYNALTYKGDTRSLIEDAIGGHGNDVIWGNQIGNRLKGGAGNDSLSGWEGNDRLIGGAGHDTFVFKRGWDHDTIARLDSHDRIDLRTFKFAGFNELMKHAENDGHGVTISFGGGDSLTIEHIHKADLHGSDFML